MTSPGPIGRILLRAARLYYAADATAATLGVGFWFAAFFLDLYFGVLYALGPHNAGDLTPTPVAAVAHGHLTAYHYLLAHPVTVASYALVAALASLTLATLTELLAQRTRHHTQAGL